MTSTGASLTVIGTNGYRASIGGSRHGVFVDIHAGKVGATYSTRGRTGRRHIDTEFGSFGGVHVRFIPAGEPTVRRIPFPKGFGCEGTTTIRRGHWEGQVEFIPEGAFTTISATSARGAIFTDRIRCATEPTPPDLGEVEKSPEQTLLTAHVGRRFDVGPSFDAVHIEGRRRVYFSAAVDRRVGAVHVSNYAQTSAPKSAFRYDLDRRRARVTPPAPFSGSAILTKAVGEEAVWSGDLAVNLLSGPLALTGPDFRAALNPPGVFVIVGRRADPFHRPAWPPTGVPAG